MKSYKKTFIILLCVSLFLTATAAIVFVAVKPEGTIADLIFFIFICGIALLTAAFITLGVKRQQLKRSEYVLECFKNFDSAIYVCGVCGNNRKDKSDSTKNAMSFAGALFFAAALGTGVYSLSDSRNKMEFVIANDEMYGCETKESLTIGNKYAPVDNLKTTFKAVYKGWFARHTITQKRSKVILTAADGHSYIEFDLTACNVSRERLIAALENVFGKQIITQKEMHYGKDDKNDD